MRELMKFMQFPIYQSNGNGKFKVNIARSWKRLFDA